MRTTVVVATRDRCPELLHTLDRLAALPTPPPVVVVDNGSTDGTPGTVRRSHPGAMVVALGRNAGAHARTVGAARATTPYVAFSDDDSWWEPGALERAERALDASPRLALLAASIRIGADRRLDPISAAMAAAPLGTAKDLPGPSVLGFLACGAVVRRRALLSARAFPERLLIGGEEQLLAWDLAAAGHGLAYVEDVVAHHAPSLRHRGDDTRRVLVDSNAVLATWLRRPLPVARASSAELSRAARHDPVARAAARRALALLPWAARHRRALPAAVEAAVRHLETPGPVPEVAPLRRAA